MSLPVNALIALICCLCAILLLRGYLRAGARLLLWGGLCFGGLTISNTLLLVDLALVPQMDLYAVRLGAAALALLLLVYGLIFESD